MKKAGILILFAFATTALQATTIVIYITPGFVIMAADSKGTYRNVRTSEITIRIVPKIFKSGHYYFALAGIVSGSAVSMDISKTVNDALKKDSSIDKAIQRIKVNVAAAIKGYLSYNQKHRPALFDQDLQSGIYITSIGIIGIKNNKPYAHILGFKVVNGKELQIITEEDYCPSAVTEASVFYLGKSDAIKKYMDTTRNITLPPAEFVDKLVSLQIAKTPQYVGPPVDILQITTKGTIWLRRKEHTPVEMRQ